MLTVKGNGMMQSPLSFSTSTSKLMVSPSVTAWFSSPTRMLAVSSLLISTQLLQAVRESTLMG